MKKEKISIIQQNDPEFSVVLQRRLLVRKVITIGIVGILAVAFFGLCMLALGSSFTVQIGQNKMYEYKAKVIRVVDGDTIEVELDLGFHTFRKEHIRLLRVNTPEVWGVKKESPEYVRGTKASAFTKYWCDFADSKVTIQTIKDRKGARGRYLAEVWSAGGNNVGENLQDAIIAAGHDKNSPLTYSD